jgi:hypothetical protein
MGYALLVAHKLNGSWDVPSLQEDFDIQGEMAKGSFGVVYKAVRKGRVHLYALPWLRNVEVTSQ